VIAPSLGAAPAGLGCGRKLGYERRRSAFRAQLGGDPNDRAPRDLDVAGVLEPVLFELDRALSDPALPEDKRGFYEDDLLRLQKVLDTLRSQRQ